MKKLSPVCASTNGHLHNLNNLPDLVYYHILKNLDIDDLWNSRLISKRFYSIVKGLQIRELSFLDFDSLSLNNWFSTTKPARPEYQLHVSKTSLLSNPSSNLLNLKYLRIGNYCQLSSDRLDDLNKFTRLEILEIKNIESSTNHLLQLPNLKALNIFFTGDASNAGGLINLDTPNLQLFSIYSKRNRIDNELKFNHPLSIKYLRLQCFDKNASMFVNLECLEVFHGRIPNLELCDLLKFNRLKTLRYVNCFLSEVDKMKDLFRSKKRSLELVLNGVRIKEISKIDEYEEKDKTTLDFQLSNYGDLENNLNFILGVNYNRDIMRLWPKNQPSDLFNKLVNIQAISVHGTVINAKRLTRFIRECPNLIRLSFKRSTLDQQFYDQLHTIKSLAYLVIDEKEEALNLDFKFLMKMPYLRCLLTDQDVLISRQLNLNDFKRFKILKFRIRNRSIEVIKEAKDKYHVSNLSNHKYWDYSTLVKWSERLRDKVQTSRKRKLSVG